MKLVQWKVRVLDSRVIISIHSGVNVIYKLQGLMKLYILKRLNKSQYTRVENDRISSSEATQHNA